MALLQIDQPYEIDANKFAFEKCQNIFQNEDLKKLNQLYLKRQPTGKFSQNEYRDLFAKIDKFAK